ncbi:MAG: Amuc_1100 family pilus-like protein [Kiritimatiellae bacterium]|nr:Amuc_1100 family pilus-like protein [Kiritimatiellia bacterium]
MSRKHMPLIVGGAVSLVLLLGAGSFLFVQQGGYAEKIESMDSVGTKLKKLTDRKPFPSASNVNRLDSQLEVYTAYQDSLFSSMSKGQEAVGTVDQDRFRRLLAESLTKLIREARAQSVAIPVQFPFGFQRYVAGSLPDPDEMPRLMSQLQGVTQLCHILYESGISELLGVERTEFEKAAGGPSAEAESDMSSRRGRRGRGGEEENADAAAAAKALYTDPDGLFTKEHYILRFRAKDAAIQAVLDRLAKGAPFTVVTRMDLVNPNRPVVIVQPDPGAPAGQPPPSFGPGGWQAPPPVRGPGGPEVKENEPLPRDLRVIAGREIPEIRLEIDLYRFVEPARGDDDADGTEEESK